MKIKIYASVKADAPTPGPYKAIDVVARDSSYHVGDTTHYGEVVLLMPPELLNDGVEQAVVVKLAPMSIGTWCEESVMEKPPTSYDRIQFTPINASTLGWGTDPLVGHYQILPSENLTIENLSHLISEKTFSLWKADCGISRRTAESLDSMTFAIVHRRPSASPSDEGLQGPSTLLIEQADSCLSLIRPTRKSRVMQIRGVITTGGTLDPQGFSVREDLADVPEVQKIFGVREEDIRLLTSILPEFIQLYKTDDDGKMQEYEPLRMAVQLYGEGYALSYWKARHILWWSAIEALYGSSEDAAMARIYSFFGNKNLVDGYNCQIYEKGDIPSCFVALPDSLHTLGKMVGLIYKVRNASAHGQKVPDSYFAPIAHPFGQNISIIEALAEASTFIIRKTVIEVLRRGWREKFKDNYTRDDFWLYEYGLNKHQSKKRLRELEDFLKVKHP
jgi:hypothetical protein